MSDPPRPLLPFSGVGETVQPIPHRLRFPSFWRCTTPRVEEVEPHRVFNSSFG